MKETRDEKIINYTNKQKRRGIFIDLTREKSKSEIQRKEKKLERRLTSKEKNKIIEKNAKLLKSRVIRKTIASVLLSSAIFITGVGVGEHHANVKMLNAVEENEKANEKSAHDKYVSQLSPENYANDSKYEKKDETEVIKERVKTEIESLEKPVEVLEYVKGIYVDEYNRVNNTNISIEDVRLSKDRAVSVYIEKLEDGTKIFLYGNEDGKDEADTSVGVEKVYITIGDESISESTIKEYAFAEGGYKNVYYDIEDYQKENYVITNLGPIISNGIDLYSAYKSEENGYKSDDKNIYLDRLEESVYKYECQKLGLDYEIEDNEIKNVEGFEIDD